MQVAIKALIVIHRTLREGDPTFREELLNYSHRGHVLQISNFKDDSSPLGTLFQPDHFKVVRLFDFVTNNNIHFLDQNMSLQLGIVLLGSGPMRSF